MSASAQREGRLPDRGTPVGLWVRSALRRGALLLALWWVLSGAAEGVWVYALPATLLTVALSLWVLPPRERRASVPRMLVLLPVFGWYALQGGADVAGRALRPSLPLDPGFVTVELQQASPAVMIALGYVITLLPGSLAVRIDETAVELHVLDRHLPFQAMVGGVERWLRWALEPKTKVHE